MKVAIIGTGYVGLVTGTCLAEIGHDVICIDNNQKKVDMLKNGDIPIYEPGLEELVRKNVQEKRLSFSGSIEDGVKSSELIFIAVSTPPRPDGAADLSFVEKVARDIADCMTDYRIIIDKSTVPVHTGEKVAETIQRYRKNKVDFDVVSNPEFLREGSAIGDFLKPDRIVVGVSSEKAAEKMKELYAPLNKPVIITNIKSAEIIKHASNSFLAMKISFANALSRICDKSGANIDEVVEGMGLDERIGNRFLNAGLGYGGSCFPKDVSAFIQISGQLGYDFSLLKAVEKVNEEQRDFFFKKIESAFWVLNGKKIAVWGLSFKPNTDDMRCSPIIPVIKKLISEGSEIIAWDPEAMENASREVEGIEFGNEMYEMLKGCDGLIIATEWEHFVNADLEKVKNSLNYPVIVDGRNIFSPELMKEKGFEYFSIGRN